jgi:septum formation protein
MSRPLILASGSATRRGLLVGAGLDVAVVPARIDEPSIRRALIAERASARDIADALAEMKAKKVAEKNPASLVLGCDQVLDFAGQIWGKPETPGQAVIQLKALRSQRHSLFSALVLYDSGQPIWRHVGVAHLTMRSFSDGWLDGYVTRNWHAIQHSAGAYLIEQEGIRLFRQIDGDYHTILGLPMLPLLTYLTDRGFIAT